MGRCVKGEREQWGESAPGRITMYQEADPSHGKCTMYDWGAPLIT